MESVYSNILDLMVTKGYISKENQDLYLYAMKVLFRSIINMTALFVTGIVLGLLKESIFMFLSFFVLRKFAGGLHSDKYITCFVSSLFISISGLLLIKNAWFVSKNIFTIIMSVSASLIIAFSPVKHQNKKISNKEEKIYKVLSSVLSVVICGLSTLLVFNEFGFETGYSLGTGLITASLLMVAGKVKLLICTKKE